MEEFTIRKAVVGDADQIAVLLGELGYPNTPAFAKSKIVKLSKSSSDSVFVAEADNRVVAVAHLHIAELLHEPGRLGRIIAIVVTNNYLRRGIGRKFMISLETLARDAGCTKMELTSSIHRKGAHAFYKSLEYIEKPRRFVKVLE